MPEKAEPEHDAAPAAPVAVPVTAPPVAASQVATVQALQRSAGNQAVARWMLAREGTATAPPPGTPPTPAKAVPREDHVFLMGDAKSDAFYVEARGYYAQKFPKAAIHEVLALSEVLAQVKQSKAPIGHLIIVSHAHEDGTLMFKLDPNDADNRLDYNELKGANEKGNMPAVDQKIVDEQTKIEIRGCNIGRSPRMLNQLDQAFGGKAKVSAPKHEQHYSHDTSGTYHEDFSGYFVEYPGKQAKGAAELQKAFAEKYSFVDPKQWPGLVKKATKFDDRQGPYFIDVAMPDDKSALTVFQAELDADKPASDGWKITFVKRTPKQRRVRVRVPRLPARPPGQAREGDGEDGRLAAAHRRSRGDGA